MLSMGESIVHPLDGVDNKLSFKSTKSILSMPTAPRLHQKPTQINWFGGLIFIGKYGPMSTFHF